MFLARWDHFLGDEAQTGDLDHLEVFRQASPTLCRWFELDSRVDTPNPIERLIQRVYANISAAGFDAAGSGEPVSPSASALALLAAAGAQSRGVEYWSNVNREGEEQPWHLDKDELLWQQARQMRHPLIASVYYPAHCACEGGELIIDSDSVSVTPAPDTLVAFAGNLRHRVRAVTKGVRWSIAMNFFATVPEAYRERPRE
jgi:hypothetical protein